MLHEFIGRDAFKAGMKAYLTEHSYKNTLTADLWKALGEASGKPIDRYYIPPGNLPINQCFRTI